MNEERQRIPHNALQVNGQPLDIAELLRAFRSGEQQLVEITGDGEERIEITVE